MSFFTIKQIKATRKKCRCYWCFEPIDVGQPKTTTATIWEGDFQANTFHPECFEALDKWQSETGEDQWPGQGDMKRGSTEPK